MNSLKYNDNLDNMEKIEIVFEEKQSTRIDGFISCNIEDISRSYSQKLIESGNVLVNGAIVTSKKEKLKTGDEILIYMPEPEELKILAEDIKIDIVYEDNDVIIVNKPQGMVVHPAPGNYTGTLVNALMYHTERLSSINGIIRPGIVHRIDKNTSGLLMIAKNNMAHNYLAEQLKDHSSTREYIAIVHDRINQNTGTIDLPIARNPRNRLKMAVVQGGKNAVTHFEVLERFNSFTYVKLKLETGRTHQIRVHMSYIKHPLLGDELYGVKKSKIKCSGQTLHAKKLGFIHPSTKEYMEFDSKVPEYFQNLLNKIRNIG
jgi:23S rRNA pseudouridine1911/1915/1917 synthase